MQLWNDRRLRLSLTRLGVQYLLVLLAVGAFSVNTGNNLLHLVFALMLGLFLVSGILSRRVLQGLQVTGLEAGSLFARVRGGLRLRLRATGRGRLRGLELHLTLDDATVQPGFLERDSLTGESVVVLHARAGHRGWTRVRALELRTCYPFGLMEKARILPLEESLLILPHPRTPPAAPASWRGEGRHSLLKEGTSSPEGTRPLRQGDAPGRVHWKRTAQRGQPWVRTFEEDRPLGMHLRLDLQAWGPGRPFERELERLSGAVLQARLQKRAISLELHDPEGVREFRGHAPCWRALALAQATGTGEDATGISHVVAAPLS